jgi:hypothetical protein
MMPMTRMSLLRRRSRIWRPSFERFATVGLCSQLTLLQSDLEVAEKQRKIQMTELELERVEGVCSL